MSKNTSLKFLGVKELKSSYDDEEPTCLSM